LLCKGKGFRRFVILTEALKFDLLKQYPSIFESSQIITAPDGVELDQFRNLPIPRIARKQLGLNFGENIVAGYAGSFYPRKGVKTIFDIAVRCPEIKFLIMGGEPREYVEFFADKIKKEKLDNVILKGFVKQNELPLYLAACDVLLLPNQPSEEKSSFGDNFIRWTSPMKLFEYMAIGRLIIASDLPVLREVINEKNAVFCPPGDVISWKLALRNFGKNKGLRNKLSSQARKDVAKYDWPHRVSHCLEDIDL